MERGGAARAVGLLGELARFGERREPQFLAVRFLNRPDAIGPSRVPTKNPAISHRWCAKPRPRLPWRSRAVLAPLGQVFSNPVSVFRPSRLGPRKHHGPSAACNPVAQHKIPVSKTNRIVISPQLQVKEGASRGIPTTLPGTMRSRANSSLVGVAVPGAGTMPRFQNATVANPYYSSEANTGSAAEAPSFAGVHSTPTQPSYFRS